MKKNIAFFITSLGSGGIENYLLRFLKSRHHNFGTLYVVCKSGLKGELEQYYDKISNVKIVAQKIRFCSLGDHLKIARFIKENNVEVVCDFSGDFSGSILFISFYLKIKRRICFYRESERQYEKTFFKELYVFVSRKLVYFFATDIFSNSKAAFENYFMHSWKKNEKFKVIKNGIDNRMFKRDASLSLRKRLKLSQDDFVLGHIGRVTPAKNHSTIIEVALLLFEKYNNAYLLLCGFGTRQYVEQLSIPIRLKSRILTFDFRDDIPAVLNTINCFYFPSLNEGQPNALLEAMMIGLPFVSSNVKPIKEIVPEEYHSYLVDPIDASKALKLIVKIKEENEFDSGSLSRIIQMKYDVVKMFNLFEQELIK